MGLWHSQPCQKNCLSRERARKRKAESFGGGGGGKERKAEEEEEKKKQKLDKSLHKELAKRSSSKSSEGRGRSQPVKLTPAPTAVEKTVVKDEPDWSEESEAPKKGKKKTVTGPKLDKDAKVTDGPQGSIQVPSYASDVASLASKASLDTKLDKSLDSRKGMWVVKKSAALGKRAFVDWHNTFEVGEAIPKSHIEAIQLLQQKGWYVFLACFCGPKREEGQDNTGHLASQV